MRLCYFDDYRYSADLDFSVVAGSEADAYATIQSALENAGAVILGMHLTNKVPPRIAYVSPLGRARNLKLDIATDELVLNTQEKGLLHRWPYPPTAADVLVYTLSEIAGEKIRCFVQRLECRDLFDLSLLLETGCVDAELREHIAGDVPHFERVERYVTRSLRQAGLP